MRVAIIDCGAGNLHSVEKAVRRILPEGVGTADIITNPEPLGEYTHIILPGVGAFADCLQGLQAISGMVAALEEEVLRKKKPFLGICVGMQMLFERSHEHGVTNGLGWLKGEVVPITPDDKVLKVPHMGWNELQFKQDSPLTSSIDNGAHVYFVHSYHVVCADATDVLAEVQYGDPLCAAVVRGNIMGTQFHPEKSQAAGLQLLRNFVEL